MSEINNDVVYLTETQYIVHNKEGKKEIIVTSIIHHCLVLNSRYGDAQL